MTGPSVDRKPGVERDRQTRNTAPSGYARRPASDRAHRALRRTFVAHTPSRPVPGARHRPRAGHQQGSRGLRWPPISTPRLHRRVGATRLPQSPVCERLVAAAREARFGRGAGARWLAIGGRAAPAFVKSSCDALTARIHATERRARMRPMDRRAAASGGSGRLRRARADVRSGRGGSARLGPCHASFALAKGRVALSRGRGSSTASVVGSTTDAPAFVRGRVRTFGRRSSVGASTAARRRARRRPRQTARRASAARVSPRLRGAAARA